MDAEEKENHYKKRENIISKKKEKRKRRWKIPGLKVEDKETEGLKRERER